MEPNLVNPTPIQTPTPVGPTPPTMDNSFFQVQPVQTPFAVKHATMILIIGSIISLLIAAVGIIYQVTYQATDNSGQNVAALQSQIDQLDSQIADLSAKDQEIFATSGFSESFYQSSTARTELELKKTDLQSTLDNLHAINASANIFNTGAIYFFLAALFCGIVTITIFLALRHRRPHSNSIIAN